MNRIILIKYGELTTKKANRNAFINLLTNNINKILKEENLKIIKVRVRMYIHVEDSKIEEVANKLTKVFGIHGIVICHEVHTNKEEIEEKIKEILREVPFKTFKVDTSRADKDFPIPSMEFSAQMGGVILKEFSCKVDVHNPDIIVHIEIRKEGTFIYLNQIPGIGGYPVGVQGKGLLMLSGGIDSPVAGFLSLKRGVDLECLYFESPPHTSMDAKNKVLKLASIINAYSGNIKVHVVPFTKLQEAIYKYAPSNYMITIMRRMMYRIGEAMCQKTKCKVIINGESIGQVASQTLDSMKVINSVTNLPVIRPVACLDKLEIIDIAEKIGTYQTSILPFEDCCTIFLPKHPIIRPEEAKCIEIEKTFDYASLIEDCINNIETIENLETKKSNLL